jgi:hypothetical protein
MITQHQYFGYTQSADECGQETGVWSCSSAHEAKMGPIHSQDLRRSKLEEHLPSTTVLLHQIPLNR